MKVVKQMAEDGRVAVRNLRRSGRHELEALEKDGDLSEDELQRAEKELDKITHAREAEIDQALQQQGAGVARGLTVPDADDQDRPSRWTTEEAQADRRRPGEPTEGVRIIGAEEAAEAMERGDVASRRTEDEPRYGDRPARPPAGPDRRCGSRSTPAPTPPRSRSPASARADPPASEPVTGPVEMPHWTEPPTGEVPKVVIGERS